MYEFKLPDLGEGIHEGEILKWHVDENTVVAEDAPLVDIETDKAAITIPSPKAGRVMSLNATAGDTVMVGDVVVVIDDGSSGQPQEPSVADERRASRPSESQVEENEKSQAPPASWGPVIAAPATRRLARELNVDIHKVPPTGPAGRVTSDDVRLFAEQPMPLAESAAVQPSTDSPSAETIKPSKQDAAAVANGIPFLDIEPMPNFEEWGPVERTPLRSIRRKVARKMVTSMVLVPHVAHMDEADVTLLEEFRLKEREKREGQPGGRLTLLPFVMKAVTAGLRAAPAFNASLDPFAEEIIYKRYYSLGIAVDTGHGLVVPVVRDTDRKSILQVSQELEQLAGKCRDGTIEVSQLRGGTFTITNVGPLGGTALIPTINYPEVAILGMGRVREKPVVVDGQIVVRKMLPLTLAFDHRIADGADAARFVSEMVRQLSDPTLLMLET